MQDSAALAVVVAEDDISGGREKVWRGRKGRGGEVDGLPGVDGTWE